jgi:hypothetical protein
MFILFLDYNSPTHSVLIPNLQRRKVRQNFVWLVWRVNLRSLNVTVTTLRSLVYPRIRIWNHCEFSSDSWFGMWFFFQQKIAISFIAFCKHLAIRPLHFRRLFRVMCLYLLIDWSFEIGILICIGIIFWNLDSQLLFLKRKWWRTGSWWATSLLPLALFAYRGNGITSLRLNFRSSSGWRPSS